MTELAWDDALDELDTVPAYDDLAFDECLRRLEADEFEPAEELATRRLRSRWVIADQSEHGGQRWLVAYAVARLRRLIGAHRQAPTQSLGGLLHAYAETDWEIDRAHRRLEVALLALTDRRTLEEPVRKARKTYDSWLDTYRWMATSAAEIEGLNADGLFAQGQTHTIMVAPQAKHGPVAYFLVDALRFELGQDLVDALRRQFEGGDISIRPSLALLPSLTPVGMANLCPGAESGIELTLDPSDHLAVTIDGQRVMTPAERVSRLRAAHGQVTDLRLDDIVRFSEHELSESIFGSNLVVGPLPGDR